MIPDELLPALIRIAVNLLPYSLIALPCILLPWLDRRAARKAHNPLRYQASEDAAAPKEPALDFFQRWMKYHEVIDFKEARQKRAQKRPPAPPIS